jgi:predicted O-methyltransferase YrrM
MSRDVWAAVDGYFADLLRLSDPVLEAALADSTAAGLPSQAVWPAQGRFLHLLARMQGARNILEIGTLGGYSTIWLARALAPGGRLVTLEREPHHVSVARANLVRAQLSGVRIDIRLGEAADSLRALAAEGGEPFDFVFIDADPWGKADYFDAAVGLSRPGGAIVVDNVVRAGTVMNETTADGSLEALRGFNQRLATDTRVTATVMQTVSGKSHDGFVLALVN